MTINGALDHETAIAGGHEARRVYARRAGVKKSGTRAKDNKFNTPLGAHSFQGASGPGTSVLLLRTVQYLSVLVQYPTYTVSLVR